MNPLTLLGEIQKLITEHGSAEVLKQHVGLLRDSVNSLEKKVGMLEARNAELEEANRELRNEVANKTRIAQFVEERGALFKRKPDGRYDKAVYCPTCQKPMGSLMNEMPFCCRSCHISLGFNGHELDEVMKGLP